MNNINDTRNRASSSAGRSWNVAVLVWLSTCCTAAVVLLVNSQFYGLEHFSTDKGWSELRDFGRSALIYPGIVLPALIVARPRWSVFMCALLLAAQLYLAVTWASALHAVPAFWIVNVLPLGLLGWATLIAYRRRDWLVSSASASAA